MTPDLLKQISAIVNTDFASHNLNEISQEEKAENKPSSGSAQTKRSSVVKPETTQPVGFRRLIQTLAAPKTYKVKNGARAYQLHTGSDTDMPGGTYMRISADKSINVQVDKTQGSISVSVKAGDLLFKDHLSNRVRVVRKKAIGTEYNGTVGSPLKPIGSRTGYVYRSGPSEVYLSGHIKNKCNPGNMIIFDGGECVCMPHQEFSKIFDN